MLVGRKEEIEVLRENIQKRRHILLTGKMGCGKSAILREIYKLFSEDGKVLILLCEQSTPLKSLLLDLGRQLHEKYKALRIQGFEEGIIESLEWKQLNRRFTRMNVREQTSCILDSIQGNGYVVILDQLEKVTPTGQAFIEALLGKTCVVGATCDQRSSGQLARMWWRFRKIEIGNLGKAEAMELIDRLIEENKILASDIGVFKREVYKKSQGNPMAIVDIINAGSLERYISQSHIRDMETHDAGKREFDLTPFVLFIGVIAVGARFVALGMNNVDLYILAGVAGGGFMFLRYFLYRMMRKR